MVLISRRCVSSRPMQRSLSFRRALFFATTVSISRAKAFIGHPNLSSVSPSRCTFSSGCKHWSSRIPDEHPRECILKRSPKEDEDILDRTLDWVQRAVIGLNLCPFAEKPFQKRQMNLEVIRGTDQVDILAKVLGECLVREKQPGTCTYLDVQC